MASNWAASLLQLKEQGGGLPGAYFVRRKTEVDHFAVTVLTDWKRVDHYLLVCRSRPNHPHLVSSFTLADV